jgi:4-diphosphocytidyl-2-C-methyl-D-erythritol kinase
VTLACTGADCGAEQRNLAYRAAQILAEGRDVPGVDISLVKSIPPGGGVGGGSSDAAAVLVALRTLWKLDLSNADLAGMAAELGSDVPLFLGGPASRMTGRGEHLEPVTVHPFLAVLILPGFACPTGEVYRAFDEAPAPKAPPLSLDTLRAPPSVWRRHLVNDLAAAAGRVCPELACLYAKLSDAVAPPVCLTGSGSTMFVLCDDPPEAAATAAAIRGVTDSEVLVVEQNPW